MNNRKENEQSCIVIKKRVHRALRHTSLYFREKSTLLIKKSIDI